MAAKAKEDAKRARLREEAKRLREQLAESDAAPVAEPARRGDNLRKASPPRRQYTLNVQPLEERTR